MCGEKVTYYCCIKCKFVRTSWFDGFGEIDFQRKIYNKTYYLEVDPDYASKRPTVLSFSIAYAAYFVGWYKILDYGGGNGVTSKKINKRSEKLKAKSFDPYGKRENIFGFKPDLVTMIEVMEHAVHPRDLMREVSGFFNNGRPIIFFTTQLSGSNPNSKYIAPRNGRVSIFNRKSLRVLSKKSGYKCVSIRNSHIFYKTGVFKVYFFLLMHEVLKISYSVHLKLKDYMKGNIFLP